MTRSRQTSAILETVKALSLLLGSSMLVLGQSPPNDFPPIGVIKIYGLRKIPETRVRKALRLRVGGNLPSSQAEIEELEKRVLGVSGVRRVHLSMGCCSAGRSSVQVGIEETDAPRIEFHAPPTRGIRLPEEILQTYHQSMQAWADAIRIGENQEDTESGHSLMVNPAVRALQERFIEHAASGLETIREVLRNAADAEQREAAAWVIGYAQDKRLIIDDLIYATGDSNPGVRNNATRALAAISVLALQRPELGIRIPFSPLIELLNSPVWTDRNKALAVLVNLTSNRGTEILRELRERALPPLVEMARGKDYDRFAYLLLGRIAGLAEEQIHKASSSKARERVIAQVVGRPAER